MLAISFGEKSALFRHGLIEQVPEVIYAVTLGRARRIGTPAGTVSLHRMPPQLFGGFETADDGTKVATSEKALFDLLYLSPTRTRLFVHLPEIDFPKPSAGQRSPAGRKGSPAKADGRSSNKNWLRLGRGNPR